MKWPESQVSGLRCPFSLPPNAQDDVPASYTQNLRHLQSGTDGAPWDGYYATYNSAKLAVSHECGVWFEIRKHENGWEAVVSTRKVTVKRYNYFTQRVLITTDKF
jgi:hypothetical protein